ncbi:MAG: TIGR02757 family protein [Elusimicrobiota bacterium]|jgi:uncharacterized protein (TIGR02757 family)|nr:TIGR02757 family protein [Elusimicrobiota bacterium]
MISKVFLEKIYKQYNKPGLISPDPLQFVQNYTSNKDKEIAALIAASLAYGNVKQIIKTVGRVLEPMGKSPRSFLLKTDKKTLNKLFTGFKYRFTTQTELVNFLNAITQILKENGSLENLFYSFYKEDKNFLSALRSFAAKLRSYDKVDTLIPNPAKNSALKRLNLFLRWAVRKDSVDPGFWDKIPTSGLIVPLDVHMHRAAKKLGLTKRKQADMKTALEISAAFSRLCPHDPIKYDFCLTRFGIRDDMSEDDLK